MIETIKNDIDREIEKIEKEQIQCLNDSQILEIIELLETIDEDLKNLLRILKEALLQINDRVEKTYLLIKLLKFYGFNNNDILSTRNKLILEDGNLVKKPFLKHSQKEMLSLLLQQMNVKVF